MRLTKLAGLLITLAGSAVGQAQQEPSAAEARAEALRSSAPEPQAPFGYLFNLDQPPQLVWRSAALLELGLQPVIEEVAWFDADGKRFAKPAHGGRWIAIIRSRLPDGRTVIRSATLFGRPEGFFLVPLESLGFRLEEVTEGVAEPLAAHRREIRGMIERSLLEELNGEETLEQTATQQYSGDGFDLVGTAMQLLTGETTTRLLHQAYFEPLGLPAMPCDQMGSGARPTVFQLAVLGQILANEGRYGPWEFFSRETFEAVLPTAYEGYAHHDPDNKLHYYGLGIRWVREDRGQAGQPLFSRRTVGHGSFSFSVFLVDLDHKIVVAQVREKNSKADATWYPRFLQAARRLAGPGG